MAIQGHARWLEKAKSGLPPHGGPPIRSRIGGRGHLDLLDRIEWAGLLLFFALLNPRPVQLLVVIAFPG